MAGSLWFAEALDDSCDHFLDPARCAECRDRKAAREAVLAAPGTEAARS
jgi:hypothetical protein